MTAMRQLDQYLGRLAHDSSSPFISVSKHIDPMNFLLMPLSSGKNDAA